MRELPTLAQLPRPAAVDALRRACVIKLNGGLGTSMGLEGPKSLLEARDGLTFLDVIGRQVGALRARHGVRLPLVLMQSFRTQGAVPNVTDVVEFLQHKVPKLRADTLDAVEWPADPALEWCPPGHGDLYASLLSSGVRDDLLADGIRYAFVSNADNLGAVLDPVILEWFAAGGAPFAMETVLGTEADRKGGHIAWRDGRLVLRETAQAPDQHSFQDFRRWRYYNTNNLWLDLEALVEVPALPLIVNRRRSTQLTPRHPGDPDRAAMRAAIGASTVRGRCASRARLVPVSHRRSARAALDVYRCVATAASRASPAAVHRARSLDFKRVGDFEARFPHGAPSLRACRAFRRPRRRDLRPSRRGAGPRGGLRRRAGRHGAGGGVPSSRGDAEVSTGQPREDREDRLRQGGAGTVPCRG